MTENTEPRTETADGQQWLPQPAQTQATAPVPYGAQPLAAYGIPIHGAPLGQVRSTGACIALTIVTLGIYSLGLVLQDPRGDEAPHQHRTGWRARAGARDLRRHRDAVHLVERGRRALRASRDARPVSGATGLWVLLLGWFFGVGLIVWFVKTNGALNDYWRSQGAR